MTLWRSSIRLRLSARYVAGLSLLLLAFGAGVYAVVRARLWRELQSRAAAELEGLARVVEQEGVSSPEELDEQVTVPFLLQDSAGASVYVSPAWLDLGLPRSVSVEELAAQGEWLRRQPRTVLLAQRRVFAEQRELVVLVALEATEIERSLSALLLALLTGTATALACALGMGYWLAGSALAPRSFQPHSVGRAPAPQAFTLGGRACRSRARTTSSTGSRWPSMRSSSVCRRRSASWAASARTRRTNCARR